jgi:hypothetical protein
MKRLLVGAWLLVGGALAQGQTVVDFQDRSLPGPNTAYYGQDSAGGFTSRGASFNNVYTDFGGGFYVWDGFAYSNVVDTTTAGFGNQYAAYHLPGGGGDHSTQYGICFSFNYSGSTVVDSFARIALPAGTRPESIRLTNTTYTALAMRDGDGFAKKFGGVTGDDPDFFRLLIQGRDSSNHLTGTVEFYLADYRFADPALDYIVSQWTSVDLSSLREMTTALTFQLTTSDVGEFGSNTPSYFALDNLAVTAVPEPLSLCLVGGLAGTVWFWRRRNRTDDPLIS